MICRCLPGAAARGLPGWVLVRLPAPAGRADPAGHRPGLAVSIVPTGPTQRRRADRAYPRTRAALRVNFVTSVDGAATVDGTPAAWRPGRQADLRLAADGLRRAGRRGRHGARGELRRVAPGRAAAGAGAWPTGCPSSRSWSIVSGSPGSRSGRSWSSPTRRSGRWSSPTPAPPADRRARDRRGRRGHHGRRRARSISPRWSAELHDAGRDPAALRGRAAPVRRADRGRPGGRALPDRVAAAGRRRRRPDRGRADRPAAARCRCGTSSPRTTCSFSGTPAHAA